MPYNTKNQSTPQRKLLLCSMTVPWPKRPTQGLYHVQQVQALNEAGIATEIYSPAPLLPTGLGRFSEYANRHLERPEQYKIEGITIHSPRVPFTFPRSLRLTFAPRFPKASFNYCKLLKRALLNHVQQHQPDALLVHGVLPWGPAATYIKRKIGIPFSVIEHAVGDIIRLQPNRPLTTQYMKYAGQADSVFAVCKPILKHLKEIGVDNAQSITNGFSWHVPADLDQQERHCKQPYILAVANYYRRKGFEELIEAYRKLVAQGIEQQLVIISEPPQSLFDQIAKANLQDRVIIQSHQSREDLYLWMKHADLFALPSWSESFGIVYAEAMSCGTPVVMTQDCGMVDELGDLLKSKDSPAGVVPVKNTQALILCIQRLLSNKKHLKKIGKIAQDFAVNRFSWQNNAATIKAGMFNL